MLKYCYFFQLQLFLKNKAFFFCFVPLISTGLPLRLSVSFISFYFLLSFFTLIPFFLFLDLIPSYFLPPPPSFSCLTQEAVISKRSVLADIFPGTSLISTRALLLANRSCLHFPPIPLNQEASQPTDPRVNQLQIAFSVVLRSCLLCIFLLCSCTLPCRLGKEGKRAGWMKEKD